jgi:hypothetical protein
VTRRSAALALVPAVPAFEPEAPGEPGVQAKRYPTVHECVDGGPPGACARTECRYHLAHRG